jgi:hypothetical protein
MPIIAARAEGSGPPCPRLFGVLDAAWCGPDYRPGAGSTSTSAGTMLAPSAIRSARRSAKNRYAIRIDVAEVADVRELGVQHLNRLGTEIAVPRRCTP